MSLTRLVTGENYNFFRSGRQTSIQNSGVLCVTYLYVCCIENFLNNLCFTLFLGSVVEFESVIFCVNCEMLNKGVMCAHIFSGSSLKPIFSATKSARG